MKVYIAPTVAAFAFLCMSCSKIKSKPSFFSSYTEAREYCDHAIEKKKLTKLKAYVYMGSIPKSVSVKIDAGMANFEEIITDLELDQKLEFSAEEYAQYKEEMISKESPSMQKLSRSFTPPKWSLKPEKHLVYKFKARDPEDDFLLELNIGLSHLEEGWVIACQY